jgi:hypothetical protein
VRAGHSRRMFSLANESGLPAASAIWFLVVSGVMAWPLPSSGPVVFWPAVAWIAVLVALSVATFGLLVLSRRFAAEFAYRRRTQPAYRTWLRRAIIIGLVVAMVIATLNDLRPWIGLF